MALKTGSPEWNPALPIALLTGCSSSFTVSKLALIKSNGITPGMIWTTGSLQLMSRNGNRISVINHCACKPVAKPQNCNHMTAGLLLCEYRL